MEEDRDGVTRRQVIVSGGLLAAAIAAGIDLSACSSDGSAKDAATTTTTTTATGGAGRPAKATRALSDHEHAVVEAATARLIPGPDDDPAEAGHPGAREAGVAPYIDGLLGALRDQPPRVYA